ncbi:FecR family protein [Bacteroides ovatus]|uniref:FecR family protein n=1 Tax=Bacteroides ovatus TaxID=28116 RepID=UPI00189C3C37|nr:FecR domain-containing protein [Bacteroides ovatus]MDC2624534.1 FecR domain-containing protein [Bacteroides ovatus]MDC2638441.1 FecR domain-containing protein [Bacteroides ovatus]MDC2653365.1 FecR domain-containing protein [Bacteroides ovatus]
MDKTDRNTIEELLPRYCEGVATEEERLQVEMWMSESDENRRMAKQIHALYLATDTVNVMKKVDTEKALLKVKSRMSGNRHKGTMWWQWVQRAAAILFIPLLVTLMLQYWGRNEQELAQIMEVKTNLGMMTSLTLPDGTLVYLNSESTLSYPSRFDNDTRNVTLQGEAYFEVAKNPEKKFIVSTSHQSQIEVLGTHFNVEAYEKEDRISATLVEGKIGFIYKSNDVSKKVLMDPGQKLVYDSKDNKVRLYTTSGESEIAWKEGKIIFRNTPLEEGLRMLEKRYNVEFIIKNDRLKGDSFTGTFTNQRLERILEYFQLSSQIRWRYLDSSNIKDEKSKIEIY